MEPYWINIIPLSCGEYFSNFYGYVRLHTSLAKSSVDFFKGRKPNISILYSNYMYDNLTEVLHTLYIQQGSIIFSIWSLVVPNYRVHLGMWLGKVYFLINLNLWLDVLMVAHMLLELSHAREHSFAGVVWRWLSTHITVWAGTRCQARECTASAHTHMIRVPVLQYSYFTRGLPSIIVSSPQAGM